MVPVRKRLIGDLQIHERKRVVAGIWVHFELAEVPALLEEDLHAAQCDSAERPARKAEVFRRIFFECGVQRLVTWVVQHVESNILVIRPGRENII